MVSITSINHTYGGKQPLRFDDWTIQGGDHWLLLGSSGSGKTTLIHILTGLLKPEHGKVSISGQNVYEMPGKALDKFRGQHIGLIFQQPHLIKSLSIAENLEIAQTFAGLKADRKRIDEVLDSLSIKSKAGNYPGELSQGQLQRVSIARAVINRPSLIVADEPTSSLDDRNTEQVLDLLIRQSEANRSTLIISTHDKRVKERFNHQYLLDELIQHKP